MSDHLSMHEITAPRGYKYPPFQDLIKNSAIDKDASHPLLGHQRDGHRYYVALALDPGLRVK